MELVKERRFHDKYLKLEARYKTLVIRRRYVTFYSKEVMRKIFSKSPYDRSLYDELVSLDQKRNQIINEITDLKERMDAYLTHSQC